jgi:hypothetical protein
MPLDRRDATGVCRLMGLLEHPGLSGFLNPGEAMEVALENG